MLKRKIQKVSDALKKLFKSGKNTKKYLLCKECNEVEVEVTQDIKAVTCAYCVQRQVAPPPNIKPKSDEEKFPRGWALKARYVHVDGRVFEKGKETGEVADLKKKESKTKVKKEPKKKTTSKRKVVKKKTTPKKKRGK
jgi:hypothetical protein